MTGAIKKVLKKWGIAVPDNGIVPIRRGVEATVFAVLASFLFYLYYGIGLCSDDYYFYNLVAGADFKTAGASLFNGPNLLTVPNLFYYFLILKTIAIFNISLYGIWLMIIAVAVVYSIYVFMCDYINSFAAFLFSCIAFFYPTHDATIFWILGMYIPINCAILMYAHHLINKGKYLKGSLVSFLGAFFSYASPAIGLGLSSIFLMKKRLKEFLIFVIPTISYICYGIVVKHIYYLTDWKFTNFNNPFGIAKQFIIQLCTAIDAFIGPSFFLKMYYAYLQLHPLSIFIGLVILLLFARTYDRTAKYQIIDRHLLWAFLIIAFLASLQLSITGRYPQIAFGLGNRVTFFISLPIALFLMLGLSSGKKIAVLIFAIYLFAIIGISDHWKRWSLEQKEIINRISHNKDVKDIVPKIPLFVSHNQYSKYGPLSHLEFFSSASREIFVKAIGSKLPVVPVYSISKQFRINGEYIIETKYNQKFKIDRHIYVFNSNTGRIEKFSKDRIQTYLEKLPNDKRHWIQFIKNDSLKDIIIKLSPDLGYLF
jgi:hypothetical protein